MKQLIAFVVAVLLALASSVPVPAVSAAPMECSWQYYLQEDYLGMIAMQKDMLDTATAAGQTDMMYAIADQLSLLFHEYHAFVDQWGYQVCIGGGY